MISVIIPLYNKSATIEKTLDSVFNQTSQDFEVIVVDDGSKDDSLEKVKRIKKDEKLKIITQENKGASAARNKGVTEAQFSYIAFLDADDNWEVNFIEEIIKVIEQNNHCQVISTGGRIIDSQKTTLRIEKSRKTGAVFNPEVFTNPYLYIHTSSIVIEKKAFLEAGMFPEHMKTNEDLACFFRLILKHKIYFINSCLSNYSRIVDGQLSKQKISDLPVCFVQRINHVHEYYFENNLIDRKYIFFTTYEIINRYYNAIVIKDHETLNYLHNNLSDIVKNDIKIPIQRLMNNNVTIFTKYYFLVLKVRFFLVSKIQNLLK
jgi:glycosyltransferase involved in cell wall biosynthesis